MSSKPYPTRHMPHLNVDTGTIYGRLRTLTSGRPCGHCEFPATTAITDIALLLSEVNRLHRALKHERIRSANLEAAIRAALGACDDGEADPLAYLRDEYPGHPGTCGGRE